MSLSRTRDAAAVLARASTPSAWPLTSSSSSKQSHVAVGSSSASPRSASTRAFFRRRTTCPACARQTRSFNSSSLALRSSASPPPSTAADSAPRRIAVIGGGVTGLTAAYYLARTAPASTKIILYESSDRLGGWIRTESVPVDVAGVKANIQFERGPRSFSSLHTSTKRFDSLVLYDLACDLGLSLRAPRTGQRWIWHPDRLFSMLSGGGIAHVAQIASQPGAFDFARGLAGFLFRSALPRQMPDEDLSIADWLHHLTAGDDRVASVLGSAMIHGIYGGDIHQLSARSVLDSFWTGFYWSRKARLPHAVPMAPHERELLYQMTESPQVRRIASRVNRQLLTFTDGKGMQTLTDALGEALKFQPNVEIKLNAPILDISYDKASSMVQVTEKSTTGNNSSSAPASFDNVICTTSSQLLSRLTGDKLPSLKDTRSASIMTVNIWYPFERLNPHGLGYLIPATVPAEQNPMRALGVFFDSDVLSRPASEPAGTKLFVLMGGHYYDPQDENYVPPPATEADAIQQAKWLLERQLGIPASTPCHAVAGLAKDCIPQQTVGHQERMAAAHADLQRHYDGKLLAAGGAYTKPGVMGALRAGYDVAMQALGRAANPTGTGLPANPEPVMVHASRIPAYWSKVAPQNEKR